MHHRKPVITATAALLLAFSGIIAVIAGGTAAHAATSTLCQEQTAGVSGGTYTVQNNEYDSSASECVTTDGNADFTVANSSIANATNGSPGAYPSIYQGCHWGNCSSGGLTTNPIQVSSLTTGKVTTSWSTTQPGGSSDYDVAYDIWFNQTPTTTGQPNGTELMVWLNHNGPVQPFGSEVASNVSIGGHTYNVWEGQQSSWDTVSYTMTSPATSVSNLDIGALTQDMVSRGYTKSSWYLIDVEAGFELWQGGAGLATNSFSVAVNGTGTGGGGDTVTVTNPGTQTGTVGTPASLQIHATDSAAGQTLAYSATGLPAGLSINSSTGLISGTPTASGSSSVTVTATDTTGAKGTTSFTWNISNSSGGGGGSGSCHVTYTLNSSWPGGFTAQVGIANTGTTTINGWSLTFTFPGDEKITSDFNGGFSQSGENVTLTSASYNGTIAPGANITVGFQGTWTNSVANPTSFAVNGTTCT
jgi:hypothetical protein